MTSRRRFLEMTGALAGAGLLASCGDNGGAGGSSGQMVYSTKSLEIFFYVVLSESIERAVKEAGDKFKQTDAKNDANQQFNDWKTQLLRQPAYLIANPVDSKNLVPLTKPGQRKDVPIGIVDTPLTGGEVAFTVAFDNLRAGQMAAEKTVELLKKKHGAPKGIVLDAYGTLQSSALRERRDGFDGVIRKYPNIKLLSRPTEQDENKGKAIAEASMAQYPNLDAIHTPTDSMTRPIRGAMKAAGKLVPVDDPKHIILTSIDGGPDSLTWLKEGTLDAEVGQDPVAYGQVCVEMLRKYSVQGKDVPLGPYTNKKYFWDKAPIIKSASGPRLMIPAYFIEAKDVGDKRLWGNVVTKEWGLKES